MKKRLNKDKIRHFYQQIIECYKPQIKESYWGKEDDFIDSVEDGLVDGEDSVNITCKNAQEIKFPRLLFDFLFKGDALCTFQHQIGQRYKYEDYVFIEFIESPIVTINEKTEKTGVFPITKDKNGNTEGCFFIISERQDGNYDYPKEIIPFFVSQMRVRLKIFEDRPPAYFPNHFELMKYILKIKKGQENLLMKLLYKLGANLGIVENSVIGDHPKIDIKQEIQSIIDNENNITLTNEHSENLDSLNFYVSAIRNPNPYYRFLDAYHILESFSYKYFYNYVKNLDQNMSKDKLYDEIRKHTTDQQMLKLVLINCLDNQQRIESIKDDLVNTKTQELVKSIGKDINIEEWPVDNAEKFALKLSELIYTFRNAIVHSKELDRHIEKIEDSPDSITNFIGLTNTILLKDIIENVLKKNVEKW